MAGHVAEIQARLNVQLQDLIVIFTDGGIQNHSITLLNSKIDSHDAFEFLTLCESYGKNMAFLDQDVLVAKLCTAWNLLEDSVVAERKHVLRRLRNLEADKNTDPAIITRLQNLKADLDIKKAKVMVQSLKYKFMNTVSFEKFKQAPVQKIFEENKDSSYALVKQLYSTKGKKQQQQQEAH